MASYWQRKDDQSEDLRTIKPWDEDIAHGNMYQPEPEQEKVQDEVVTSDNTEQYS